MWNISDMTARTGVPARLLRYYEQQDLITRRAALLRYADEIA